MYKWDVWDGFLAVREGDPTRVFIFLSVMSLGKHKLTRGICLDTLPKTNAYV